MTPEERARALEVLAMIQRDIEKEVNDSDGKRMTGSVVAHMYGTLAAQVDALAEIVKRMLRD